MLHNVYLIHVCEYMRVYGCVYGCVFAHVRMHVWPVLRQIRFYQVNVPTAADIYSLKEIIYTHTHMHATIYMCACVHVCINK